MKQFLSLLLFLLPCLAWAQYPSNGNQKITLGEQTTADGLIYRGVLADTGIITPSSDTSAYIILDTVNHRFYNYNRATNVWSVAGGGTAVTTFSAGTTGFTPSTATSGAVTLAGTLAVANGGTNTTTLTANKVMVGNGTSGVLTPTNLHWDNTNSRLGIGTSSPSNPLSIVTTDGSFLISSSGQFTTKQDLDLATAGARFTAQSSRGTLGRIRIQQVTTSVDGGEMSFDTSPSGSTTPTERLRIFNNGDVHIGAYDDIYSRFFVKNNSTNRNVLSLEYNNAAVTMFQVYQYTNETEFNLRNNSGVAKFRLSTNGDSFLNGGNVGIGTISPLALLNVMGTVRINSASAPDANYYLQLENSSSQKAKANAWDTYSDSRIKTNRQPIINAIDKINLLNPTYYNQHDSYVENDLLNIDYNNSYKSLGFIAQEVYEVIPEAVNMGTTNELWAMDYTKLIPVLTKAIQEQQALIKALEQRIINLENK